MCRHLLLLLLASTMMGCVSGTPMLKPERVQCNPESFNPGPPLLSILDKGTAGEIVAAHHQDASDYAELRARHLALVGCVQAYSLPPSG